MQQQIEDSDMIKTFYECDVCPVRCLLVDKVLKTNAPEISKIYNHPCHRFPSVKTNWQRRAEV